MKYKVLTPVEHNGKRFEPGKTVELDDDTAAPLLAVAAVEPASGKAKPISDESTDPAA